MSVYNGRELVYDWNLVGDVPHYNPNIEFADETLRDGLQSPSVTQPSTEEKIELLHLMVELGIHAVNIGLPGAGGKHAEDVYHLAREIADNRLPIEVYCAVRTVVADIEPAVVISQRTGIPITCATFIGSSPIRRYAEDWDMDRMLRNTEQAVRFTVSNGLPNMFVTEDTTRADPGTLRKLYKTAVECGSRRICLADTVGHVTPEGVHNLIAFIKCVIHETGEEVKIDWHGHRDRGLGLSNTLAAIAAGTDRVHGCALGIGERCGNTNLDILLVNLKLMGIIDNDLRRLPDYANLVSRACNVPIPYNYPVFGPDAFRTSSGIHAAAICKAREKGHDWLANRVYSGVPADLFGLEQIIEIGPMSGETNVRYWLRRREIEADNALVASILQTAKEAKRVLLEAEVYKLVNEWRQPAWEL